MKLLEEEIKKRQKNTIIGRKEKSTKVLRIDKGKWKNYLLYGATIIVTFSLGWIICFSIGLILGSILFNTYFYRKLKRDREEMTKKIIQDFREWIAKGDKNEVRKDSNI